MHRHCAHVSSIGHLRAMPDFRIHFSPCLPFWHGICSHKSRAHPHTKGQQQRKTRVQIGEQSRLTSRRTQARTRVRPEVKRDLTLMRFAHRHVIKSRDELLIMQVAVSVNPIPLDRGCNRM